MSDADFIIHDPVRARAVIRRSAKVEKLYGDCRWAEGPAYFPAHRTLIWSDIPNERMLRFDEETGAVAEFRRPSGFSNGNTVDRQGRLVTCEHGGRRVVRTEHDGSITVLADRWNGKRLNSPNDVVVKSDGSIWFTDPTYGIDSDYEGYKAVSEIGASNVYRIDPGTGAVDVVADDFVKPNGLCFSPDEKTLYIVDTGRTHQPDGPCHVRAFRVSDDGRLSGGEVFATSEQAGFDGLRCDELGHLWMAEDDGVHCYHPDGSLIARVLVPEWVANVEFGGARGNRLYICATGGLYAVMLAVRGAKRL
ncbi:gluconolactonase [alpha proteobacterium AAP38]|nr:gluconolactonase [alpha proteobacterium AAP38]